MHESLEIIIASYFKYFGPQVAGMLSKVGSYDTQRLVVNEFMRVIEGDLWKETDTVVEITTDLYKPTKRAVTIFVNLYHLDKLAEQTVKEVEELFNKE